MSQSCGGRDFDENVRSTGFSDLLSSSTVSKPRQEVSNNAWNSDLN